MSLGGFEREEDILERRKQRQEEWERVRTADQPECKYQRCQFFVFGKPIKMYFESETKNKKTENSFFTRQWFPKSLMTADLSMKD
jgi:hypothetical protein